MIAIRYKIYVLRDGGKCKRGHGLNIDRFIILQHVYSIYFGGNIV